MGASLYNKLRMLFLYKGDEKMKTLKIKEFINNLSRRTLRWTRDLSDLSYEEMQKIRKENVNNMLIDVRNPNEYNEGHLDGAINIPNYEIEKKIDIIVPNKKDIIILYCQSGNRSKRAQKELQQIGYENVYSLAGGIGSIRRAK